MGSINKSSINGCRIKKYFFSFEIIIRQVGKLADKGDPVACHLVAQFFKLYFIDESFSFHKEGNEWSEEKKKELSMFSGLYRNYSATGVKKDLNKYDELIAKLKD